MCAEPVPITLNRKAKWESVKAREVLPTRIST